MAISDGGPGLFAAIELHFGKSLRQRCVIHRLRNAMAKVSKGDQDEFKAGWWGVFDDIDAEPGEPTLAEARRRAQACARSLNLGSAITESRGGFGFLLTDPPTGAVAPPACRAAKHRQLEGPSR